MENGSLTRTAFSELAECAGDLLLGGSKLARKQLFHVQNCFEDWKLQTFSHSITSNQMRLMLERRKM